CNDAPLLARVAENQQWPDEKPVRQSNVQSRWSQALNLWLACVRLAHHLRSIQCLVQYTNVWPVYSRFQSVGREYQARFPSSVRTGCCPSVRLGRRPPVLNSDGQQSVVGPLACAARALEKKRSLNKGVGL